MLEVREIKSQSDWDALVLDSPHGHPLQLWNWGELKKLNGWNAHRVAVFDDDTLIGAAQILSWSVGRLPVKIAYVPRGPVIDPKSRQLAGCLEKLAEYARRLGALSLKIEPAWIDAGLPANWRRSRDQILLPETYTIDLAASRDEILSRMRHKTRQYIRKAERDGVTIETDQPGDHMGDFWVIYQATAKRAGFKTHEFEYYQRLLALYGERSRLYFAYHTGKPVAFLWLIAAAGTAFELYGGITETGSGLKANYLLKWYAISDMKGLGFKLYDFNGRLNEGVGQFKTGFGPQETNYIGSYDRVFKPLPYFVWDKLFPLAKKLKRLVGR